MLLGWFWLYIVIIFFSYLSFDLSTATSSGPFRTTVINIKVCENPYRPYMTNPPMLITMKLTNTSNNVLLSGQINILRDTKEAKSKLLGYVELNGKWKITMALNNTACHGIIMPYFCAVTGIKYDRTRRVYSKGQYSFKNLDLNAIQHMFVSKVEYGRAMWVFEAFHARQGTFYCNEFYTITEPI